MSEPIEETIEGLDGNEETIIVPGSEVQRQLEDLNDEAFTHLLNGLAALLEMFRSDAASAAVKNSLDVKDITALRDYIAQRNNDGYNKTWELIRFVQNLRTP